MTGPLTILGDRLTTDSPYIVVQLSILGGASKEAQSPSCSPISHFHFHRIAYNPRMMGWDGMGYTIGYEVDLRDMLLGKALNRGQRMRSPENLKL